MSPDGPVLIFAGRGNNGGDGFVMARHLVNRGVSVEVLYLGDLATVTPDSDAGINLFIILKMGVLVRELPKGDLAAWLDGFLAGFPVIVDALLGTGARGEIREPFLAAVRALNRTHAKVLAVDIPSGLDCDTGLPLGVAVKALVTVTFGLPKVGFFKGQGPDLCGRIVTADISLPHAAVRAVLD
jgi:NAD(P)H-hydrate epimerase